MKLEDKDFDGIAEELRRNRRQWIQGFTSDWDDTWETWLRKQSEITQEWFEYDGEREFLTLPQLKKEVKKAGVNSWGEYHKEQKMHPDWPSNPNIYYKDWVDWPNLFGKKSKR